jgi:NAD(P)-dependent dehydrogenase (short-subunit alcohol dehydrogenase family)
VEELQAQGWTVVVAGRSQTNTVTVDVSASGWTADAALGGDFSGVVWAQGMNAAGGVLEASPAQLSELYDANVAFVVRTLRELVDASRLARPARGVVISSVWQATARAQKLAYVASKAALAGVIPSLAVDLAEHQFAVNAVLPGVIDTPMTRSHLSREQIEHVESETIGGALATPVDVARAVAFLIDARSQGINAQSVVVDNGWSSVRSV